MTRVARHTCGGPTFGRLTAGCPRCDDLAAGAAPVTWRGTARARADRADRDRVAMARHAATCTDVVCTFGDW